MSAVVQMRPQAQPEADSATAVLVELTRKRSPDDRQRLLMGVAALCESTAGNRAAPALGQIFVALAAQAEREIRLTLSERLAEAAWAPPALINMLALDEIEIARPVITSSPVLQDADLMRLLIEATLEHQIAVARRPGLSRRVADAIVERGESVTMTALASNRTADISEAALTRLIEQSRRLAGLRAPLTRHPRLNEALARELYQWVGQALRQSIGERFKIDDALLDTAVKDAGDQAVRSGGWRAVPISPREDGDRRDMEARLVEKLKTAGQLRPGLLIRALREHRLALFEQTLAGLGGFTEAHTHAAVRAPTAEPLYLACIAVGVDRAVFPSLLVELRKLTGGYPGDGGWTASTLNPPAAARAFLHIMEKSAEV
ncbi:DUF2336 domain-containing protein [Brevundimonas sp. SORGH_AS_0993]|uniref:DUF2336 domain-containing protein n=1 Tax=Brevundimonas sp. SORGH_AS_0993 TaxID=3041794 RepID=UPI0027D87361|nr:DUF2336 domain-containing protein [Brevundimonas sp. SORGH_AS_0993]